MVFLQCIVTVGHRVNNFATCWTDANDSDVISSTNLCALRSINPLELRSSFIWSRLDEDWNTRQGFSEIAQSPRLVIELEFRLSFSQPSSTTKSRFYLSSQLLLPIPPFDYPTSSCQWNPFRTWYALRIQMIHYLLLSISSSQTKLNH